MLASVFLSDHIEKKSFRSTLFLRVFGPYIHPLKYELDPTSLKGRPEDFFFSIFYKTPYQDKEVAFSSSISFSYHKTLKITKLASNQ